MVCSDCLQGLCEDVTSGCFAAVVLVKSGPSAGHIAVIAEIIDHNRVRNGGLLLWFRVAVLTFLLVQAIIDGPTTSVPRQSFPYRYLTLTPLIVKDLPRAAGSGVIKKFLEKQETVSKWESSAWAKKMAAVQSRRTLSDFERFNVMVLKKQRRDSVRKAVKASAKA